MQLDPKDRDPQPEPLERPWVDDTGNGDGDTGAASKVVNPDSPEFLAFFAA